MVANRLGGLLQEVAHGGCGCEMWFRNVQLVEMQTNHVHGIDFNSLPKTRLAADKQAQLRPERICQRFRECRQ